MKDMRNIYVYKNHPHFCPRKNGDSCRPVSGFHRLKRDLHARIVIPISPMGLLRLFPCSLRVSFLSFSAGSPCGSCALPLLRFLFGAVFIVFPCPFFIAFSPFSLPLDAAFPRFICFPFVSLPIVACPWAGRYRFPPVPVSSPVSVFELSGGAVLSIPWAGGLPRGVELRGWRGVLSFRWAARFLRCAGRGVLGGFFMWKLSEGLFVGRGGFVASGGKRTPRGFICSLGAFFLIWIVLYVGCLLFPLASCDGVGGDGGGGE